MQPLYFSLQNVWWLMKMLAPSYSTEEASLALHVNCLQCSPTRAQVQQRVHHGYPRLLGFLGILLGRLAFWWRDTWGMGTLDVSFPVLGLGAAVPKL